MKPNNMLWSHSFVYALLLLISILSCLAAAGNNSSDILYDVFPFIIVYKNGTVDRLTGTDVVPASSNRIGVAMSKDVWIDPHRKISARLFLPDNIKPGRRNKLPLLVYFHGGAFVTGSAFSLTYHNYLNALVAKAKIIAVSVNYRLAPENPLPIGYEDSWRALEWVFSHSNADSGIGTEPWLRSYVDFKRVYVGGDSAGGNIAHNVAIRAGLDKTGRVDITGLFLNCPHFWGNKQIGKEGRNPQGVDLMKKIWLVAYPNSPGGFDNPASNPGMDPNLSKLGCNRVLVYVAENDILRDRGMDYARMLQKNGWRGRVRLVDVNGEGHVFNLVSPNSTEARKMMVDVASFLNEGHVMQ